MSKITYKETRTKVFGLSLVEFLVIIAILVIIITIAMPNVTRYYKTYKFNQYVLEIENTLKWARMIAMERSINVSVEVEGSAVKFYSTGENLDPQISRVMLRSISISPYDQNFIKFEATGFPIIFDPRGLTQGEEGATLFIRRTDTNVCVKFELKKMSGYIIKTVC